MLSRIWAEIFFAVLLSTLLKGNNEPSAGFFVFRPRGPLGHHDPIEGRPLMARPVSYERVSTEIYVLICFRVTSISSPCIRSAILAVHGR